MVPPSALLMPEAIGVVIKSALILREAHGGSAWVLLWAISSLNDSAHSFGENPFMSWLVFPLCCLNYGVKGI